MRLGTRRLSRALWNLTLDLGLKRISLSGRARLLSLQVSLQRRQTKVVKVLHWHQPPFQIHFPGLVLKVLMLFRSWHPVRQKSRNKEKKVDWEV